jgi:hypothetical protein
VPPGLNHRRNWRVALRDVTPEAVREIAVRELPGFGEAMRMESLKLTPMPFSHAAWPWS